jgi:hypothetical protein
VRKKGRLVLRDDLARAPQKELQQGRLLLTPDLANAEFRGENEKQRGHTGVQPLSRPMEWSHGVFSFIR